MYTILIGSILLLHIYAPMSPRSLLYNHQHRTFTTFTSLDLKIETQVEPRHTFVKPKNVLSLLCWPRHIHPTHYGTDFSQLYFDFTNLPFSSFFEYIQKNKNNNNNQTSATLITP